MKSPLRHFLVDLHHRCTHLVADLDERPATLPPRAEQYRQEMLSRARRMAERTAALLADPDFEHPDYARNYFYDYKRLAEMVQLMQEGPASVLKRFDERDALATNLVAQVCQEIRYPYRPPVCSASSAEYYWTREGMDLIFLPAAELRHLLSWPDLYHELAHIILFRARQQLLDPCADVVHRYFENAIREAQTRTWPEASVNRLADARDMWIDPWIVEFAADMIATYCVGPAYAWSNVRLSTNMGLEADDLYAGTRTHPADYARALAVDDVLRRTGWQDASSSVLEGLHKVMDIAGRTTRPHDFDLLYSGTLIGSLSELLVSKCEELGLRAHGPGAGTSLVTDLLNEAWVRFNAQPDSFPDFEREQISRLSAALLSGDMA